MLSERHTSKTWLRMKASFSIIVTNYRLKNIGYNAEKVYQPRHTAASSRRVVHRVSEFNDPLPFTRPLGLRLVVEKLRVKVL
ncbi:hypothetical protein CEXT_397711 [Caerostris extrusa]|uniref:Uncharacterized protein n=1 Tax=Caerostris extrusa TaxID=172846 RepID=A0AAV4XSJ6_CAEEX|nr:hypothetical protein CEXT_397711 [Caerostris extrusa]